MKEKILFSALLAAIMCIGSINAQITLITQITSLTGSETEILDKRISNYTAFTMDIKEITNYLYSNGGSGQFQLLIDERWDWTIDLELNDLRAPEYKATYTNEEGTFDVEETFVVNTFKGYKSDGQTVRFTIDENTFFGVILGDNYHYVIRPAKDFTQNNKDRTFIRFI